MDKNDYVAAMLDALAEGDEAKALALEDLALDAAQAPPDGLGEPSEQTAANARQAVRAFVAARMRDSTEKA